MINGSWNVQNVVGSSLQWLSSPECCPKIFSHLHSISQIPSAWLFLKQPLHSYLSHDNDCYCFTLYGTMYLIEAQAIVWTHQVGQWGRWVTENNELSFYIRETELLNKDLLGLTDGMGPSNH